MKAADFFVLAPLIILALTAAAALMLIAAQRDHRTVFFIGKGGLGLALISLPIVSSGVPRRVTPLLLVDSYALFFMGLFIAASIVVAVMNYYYMEKRESRPGEFYALLLLATLGAAVLAASVHFVSFFLGMQILSVSLYSLIAYLKKGEGGDEAGIKYLILAAVSASFLLFGLALIYAETGVMEFARLAQSGAVGEGRPLFIAGVMMVLAGIGFKLAAAPFHMWTPDVYEGSPAPVSAFIATVSKGAIFVILARFITTVVPVTMTPVFTALAALAVASMIIGNLLALAQDNIKRLLAYSSISHMGYLLIALVAGGPLGLTAAGYYLTAYFVTILAAFSIIAAVSGNERDADRLDDYRGLAWKRPALAGVFTGILLSLAGIPLTAGFLGKFYVVTAGVSAERMMLVATLVITSVMGLFYYLRVIAVLYARESESEAPALLPPALGETLLFSFLALLLVFLGIYPSPLIRLLRETVATLM